MHITAEIRWFWQQDRDSLIDNWLKETGYAAVNSEVRTDYYLVTGAGAAGLKLRSKRLEAKLLLEPISLDNSLADLGMAGKWTKWSAPETMTLADHHADGDEWLPVQKDRRIAIYLPEDRRWAKPGEQPASACEIETGKVSIKGKEYSTVCFECYCSRGEERNVLLQALNQLLKGNILDFLRSQGSQSYPEWLRSL
ncbi:hypothetical protein AB9P05_19600 [Roseivirga sp. BDSF3-8]|uniref:hypothetical protein n=1 Tax=Roseivirga sp. BDSF3-8 TaxID=3241598 RepID=UPI003531DE88